MRNLGVVAFGVTTCVLVPAALRELTAGSAEVAKLAAPGARSLEIAGTKIDVAVDRAIVDPGDRIKVKLTATAATARRITVDVLVLESVGSGGSRVESPPQRVARETVTLQAAAGGASRELAFTLPGRRGLEMEGMAPLGRYTILVMPPKVADRFERMRQRASSVRNPMEDASGRYSDFITAYYELGRTDEPDGEEDAESVRLGKPGETARLEVHTRPAGSPVALQLPGSVRLNQPFAVTVKVKNPSGKRIDELDVRLTTPQMLDSYLGLDREAIEIVDDHQVITLAPRETKQLTFHVTARATGTLGLYASTECNMCEDWNLRNRISDGALDAVDVTGEAPATLQAKR